MSCLYLIEQKNTQNIIFPHRDIIQSDQSPLIFKIFPITQHNNTSQMQRSYQVQLSKCYQNTDLINLINNQLLDLQYFPQIKCLPYFTIIKFRVPNITQNYRYITDNQYIQFYMVLGKGFPLIAPRVHVKDKLLLPGINDCRDLLYTIVQIKYWDHKITMKQIQTGISRFLTKLYKSSQKINNIYDIARFGNFNLNSLYPMELIKELRGENVFVALEFMEADDFKMIAIDISQTHLTIFTTKEQPKYINGSIKIPQEKDVTLCMLTFYAELSAVTQILVDRSNYSNIFLSFLSKKTYNSTQNQSKKTIKVKIKKGMAFLQKFIKGIKHYIPQMKISLDMQHLSQQERFILTQIQKAEQTIQHHLNIYTIRQLVNKYQQAVDFYSAENVPYYDVYLDKISKLYTREQIKLIIGMEDMNSLTKKKMRLRSL